MLSTDHQPPRERLPIIATSDEQVEGRLHSARHSVRLLPNGNCVTPKLRMASRMEIRNVARTNSLRERKVPCSWTVRGRNTLNAERAENIMEACVWDNRLGERTPQVVRDSVYFIDITYRSVRPNQQRM